MTDNADKLDVLDPKMQALIAVQRVTGPLPRDEVIPLLEWLIGELGELERLLKLEAQIGRQDVIDGMKHHR